VITEQTYLVKKEYYEDQRRAAALHRLARAAAQGGRTGPTAYAQALAWLGDRLIAWGSRLQAQYDTVVSSTISHSAKPAVGQ
jgi:hypothetical protein